MSETLTPDELNELCAIPQARYVALAEAVIAELHPATCVAMDREVLKRWYAQQEEQDGDCTA